MEPRACAARADAEADASSARSAGARCSTRSAWARVAGLCLVVCARAFAHAACPVGAIDALSPAPSPWERTFWPSLPCAALAWRRIAYVLDGDRLSDALGLVAATARAAPKGAHSEHRLSRKFRQSACSGTGDASIRSCRRSRCKRIFIPAIPIGVGALIARRAARLGAVSGPIPNRAIGDRPAVALASACRTTCSRGWTRWSMSCCSRAVLRAMSSAASRADASATSCPTRRFPRHGQRREAARRRGRSATRR